MTDTELQALPTPDAARAADEAFATRLLALRAVQVPLARMLAGWLLDGRHFHDLGASPAEWGFLRGMGSPEIRTLYSVGFVLEWRPDAEALLLEGRLSLDNAALLYELLLTNGGVREGEDWVATAVERDTAALRKLVDKRLAEVVAGGPVTYLGDYVPRDTKHRFERARDLASRKAGRRLTRGETLTTLVDFYLEKNDPLFREERRRRKRRFRRRKAEDGFSEEEKRKIRLRFGDRCALDGCTNTTFLEFAHIRPRALGGSNRAENGLELCSPHHRQFDAKMLFLRYPGSGQRPMFADRDGRRVAGLRPPPVGPPPP